MSSRNYFIWYNLKNEAESVIFDGYNPPLKPEIEDDSPVKKNKSKFGIRDIFGYLKNEYENDSFSDALIEYMRVKNLTSKDIYERSYIDRKLLNKIINNPEYHPSKKTTFNLCIALRLSYEESCEFLKKANYTFSKNSKYDLIYAYALKSREYSIDEINMVLNYFGFPCIGE